MKDIKLVTVVFNVKATDNEANSIVMDVIEYIKEKWKGERFDSHVKTFKPRR